MNVFISYRRADTQDLTGRLADRLRAVPEIQELFLDVDGIEPGADFVARIRHALAQDPVCIFMIGSGWRGGRTDGPARIFEETDIVRMEVSEALASGLRILPVLANGAEMPAASQLPADLQRLPTINAASLRHAYFEHDVDYLIDTILRRKQPGKFGTFLRSHPMHADVLRGTLGIVLAAIFLIGIGAAHRSITGMALSETLGGRGPVWLLIATLIVGGAIVGFLSRPKWRSGVRNSPRP